jgi:thiamine biosynthesis lipoprotein
MFDPAPRTVKLSRLRPLLGTFVAVEAEVESEDSASVAIEAAFAAAQQVDLLMHPTRAGSDLARLAAAAIHSPTTVDERTFEVLRLCAELNHLSNGQFDPCLPSAAGRMKDIQLIGRQVVCRAKVNLDLGGIAKGYAVDLAVQELRRHGCPSGLVNAGGDLRVFGPEPHLLRVRAARDPDIAIELRDASLAVSGARGPASPPEHRGFYSGVSGAPLEGYTVAIAAPSAAIADALCKCALLCEPPLLAKLLNIFRARLITPLMVTDAT